MPSFVDGLVADISRLSILLETMDQCLASIGYTHQNRKVHAIQTVLINVAITVRGSGILEENYTDFLRSIQSKNDQTAFREIEDVALMLKEVDFHLNRIERMLQEYVDIEKSHSGQIYKTLQDGLKKIEVLKKQLG